MIKICLVQDLCRHFKSGDRKPPNHHVRETIPCVHWIALDCEKIQSLVEVYQYATGEEIACDLKKIQRIKKVLKGGKE